MNGSGGKTSSLDEMRDLEDFFILSLSQGFVLWRGVGPSLVLVLLQKIHCDVLEAAAIKTKFVVARFKTYVVTHGRGMIMS
jgi:hypothetical protein